MKKLVFLALYLLSGPSAWAISADSPDHFSQVFEAKVEPFYNLGHHGFIRGMGSVQNIAYAYFTVPHEKGAIVILPGRGEALTQYREVIYDLGSLGYSIFILDHRGQGYSDRMIADPEMGYVDSYKNYILDLHHFMTQIVKPKNHPKTFMVAHSMGGAIGALYLEKYPTEFDAAVLSSPMMQMNLQNHTEWEAKLLVLKEAVLLKSATYAPGNGPFNWTPHFPDSVVGSELRFDKMNRLVLDDCHYEASICPALGGASYQWVGESLAMQDEIQNFAYKVKTPVYMFIAGSDSLVEPGGQKNFLKNCGSPHKSLVFPGSLHSILQEVDGIRNTAITEIGTFFEEHLK